MIDTNVAFVRAMEEEFFNRRDVSAVDRFVSASYRLRTAEEGAPSGREAIKAYIAGYLNGFPDLHISIDQLFAAADKVAGVVTMMTEPARHGPVGTRVSKRPAIRLAMSSHCCHGSA